MKFPTSWQMADTRHTSSQGDGLAHTDLGRAARQRPERGCSLPGHFRLIKGGQVDPIKVPIPRRTLRHAALGLETAVVRPRLRLPARARAEDSD
jgi:hypothetical protein